MNTSDPDYFFQSDQDLAHQARRAQRVNHTRGSAIRLSGKIIAAATAPSGTDDVYLASAGHTILKVNLGSRKTTETLKGHKGPVTSLAFWGTDHLVSGSWDKTLIIWDLKTRAPVKILEGHRDFVKSLVVQGDTAFSGSSDTQIRKWDLKTGKTLQVLEGHTRGVEDLKIHEGALYSASSDCTIRKWSVETGDLLATYKEHLTSVYCLEIHDGMLYSGSADKTVKKRDLSTGVVESTFECGDWVKSVLVVFPFLIVAGKEEDISVWDLGTEKIKLVVKGHFDEVSCLGRLQGSKFFSAGLDGTLRTWDLKDDPKVLQMDIHPGEDDQKKAEEEAKKAAENKKNVMTAEEEAELAALMDE